MSPATFLASTRGTPPVARAAAAKVDKIAARRMELAEATLSTLAELGYARTSLREIAQHSEFSHGVLHYYFTDKVDLICCGVRHFKGKNVSRYEDLLTTATDRETFLEGFCAKVGESMAIGAKMHRLWYDLRAQSLFDDAFRNDVVEIDQSLEAVTWRTVQRYAELGGRQVTVSSAVVYAMFDGLFQRHLLLHMNGDQDAIPRLMAEIRALMPVIA